MQIDTANEQQTFFTTALLPCPYLDDLMERRVVTELHGRRAESLNNLLTHSGFRRSHGIAYVPACPTCQLCTSARIVVDQFTRSRTQRKTWNRNADLTVTPCGPIATEEQFSLFRKYLESRHGDGDMASMNEDDYRALIEDSPIRTDVVEFRDEAGTLVGCCLTDRIDDGLSAVYSFFDPEHAKRSLGVYMVLWLIETAKLAELPYIYLGFWIDGCRKMDYKTNYQPLEGYRDGVWKVLNPQSVG